MASKRYGGSYTCICFSPLCDHGKSRSLFTWSFPSSVFKQRMDGHTCTFRAFYIDCFRNSCSCIQRYQRTIGIFNCFTSRIDLASLGFISGIGAEAAAFHILNHALFKASLFLVAGIIAHEAGRHQNHRRTGRS